MTTALHSVRSPDWPTTRATGPAVVVLLHGYRSDEDDLTDLIPSLDLPLPWASLRGPIDFAGGGAAWFTVTTPGNPEAGPVEEATDTVWTWLDARVDSATRIIPIGFSQGGLMATQLLRTRPHRVFAPVVLGGFVLGAPQLGDEDLIAERPAAFWGRGGEDLVMPPFAVDRTADYLQRHTSLTEGLYPGLAHNINAPEIQDVRKFLHHQLRDEASSC